jgi:IS1 family transposase
MKRLSLEKRCLLIRLLVEGNGLRASARIADVAYNSVLKLLIDVGRACLVFHQETVVKIRSKRIQCDEIWSFVYAKEKNKVEGKEYSGDAWTFVGIDQDTKLVISWYVGLRNLQSATIFMADLWSRLADRIQMTTDGFLGYEVAVAHSFGSQIDYAQLVKQYSTNSTNEKGKKDKRNRYVSADKEILSGSPDLDSASTSHIERQNLTMRMGIRRFTRKSNAFSKKITNHNYSIALHFVYYNFCRIHSSLRVTPAMEAKLIKHVMKIQDIARLSETLIAN